MKYSQKVFKNVIALISGHFSLIRTCLRFQRKPEESPVKEGLVKKVKQDDARTNGVHKANGDTNGHTNSTEVER